MNLRTAPNVVFVQAIVAGAHGSAFDIVLDEWTDACGVVANPLPLRKHGIVKHGGLVLRSFCGPPMVVQNVK